MNKRSLAFKILSIVMAAGVAVGLILAPAGVSPQTVRAQGAPNPTFLDYDADGNGIRQDSAVWSKNGIYYRNGHDSIHFSTSGQTKDYAAVAVPTNFVLGTGAGQTTAIGYWGLTVAADKHGAPDEIFLVFANGDVVANTGTPAPVGTWAPWTFRDATGWYKIDFSTNPPESAEPVDITHYYGETVQAIALGVGSPESSNGVNVDAYVDWLVVGDQTLLDEDTGTVEVRSSMPGFPSPRIQDAVDAAAPGDTISVAAGTYDGFRIENKSGITITGAGALQTTVAPTTLITTNTGHKNTSNMLASVFVDSSTNVRVQGLTIKSTTATPGAGGADAIVFWNSSSGEIKDSVIQGIYTLSGAQTGQGVAVDAAASKAASLTVMNTDIHGFQKNGIDVVNGNGATSGGANVTLSVNGGTITGSGPTDVIAQNGIVLWNRAGGDLSGTVQGTTLSGFDYTPNGTEAVAILNFGLGGGALSVHNSSLAQNELGVDNEQSSLVVDATHNWWGSASGPTYSGNPGGSGDKISDNVSYKPWCSYYGCVVPLPPPPTPTPQPPAPPFGDVPPEDPLAQYVAAIFQAGITDGCTSNPPGFCPGEDTGRDQAAKFILRGLYGPAYTPPPATGIFEDLPASDPMAPWIEGLYHAGLVQGCSTDPLRFCGGQGITRGQMAKLLVLARHGAQFSPLTAVGRFPDVGGDRWDAAWIEQLYRDGVTVGFTDGTYQPDATVNRGQMAIFLARAFLGMQ
jgi:hypothetical protein